MMTLPWLIATLAACCSVLITLAFFGAGNRVAMVRQIGVGSDGSVGCARESGGARCGKSHFNYRYGYVGTHFSTCFSIGVFRGVFQLLFTFATRP